MDTGESLDQIKEILEALGAMLRAGVLVDTCRLQYRRAWDQWQKWCVFMDYQPWLRSAALDANAVQLGAFAEFLWRFGMNKTATSNTYSIICNKLCAVRRFHKHTAGYDPGVIAGHAIRLRGICRFTDPVAKQQAVTPALLRSVYHAIDLRHPVGNYCGVGCCSPSFSFYADRRISLSETNRTSISYDFGDLLFQNKHGVSVRPHDAEAAGIIRLHGAKNNPLGREERRFYHQTGDELLCPVLAARWIWKGARVFGIRAAQSALSTAAGKGISADEISSTLK
ncbi:hypothetical protein JG688_00006438 [Phytophthora aleatoria]|uniref:Uncharacterized protein n=1 Tax=Phytophthora aleatoria TaxID=2496075 RepID=A0A8J5ITQ2_9STRA|nr:hypothetical protein JG688_00006438 [Phytophthora aleatoria]